jgi:hypothetical protein
VIAHDPTVPPWPAGAKIPRWAHDRRGRLAQPSLYSKTQLDDLDRYHVALYRLKGLFSHVVEITEHDPATGRAASLTITRVGWLRDPLRAFEAAEAKYLGLSLYFGERRN